MKKICFVTTISFTMKQFVVSLANELLKTDLFEIWMVCENDEKFAAELDPRIHFYPIHMNRGVSLTGFTAKKEMEQLFRREQFDLVQYATPNAGFYASSAAKKVGIPVRLYCQWGIRYVGLSGWKKAVFKKLEKITCSNSTVIEPDSRKNLQFDIEENLFPASKGHTVGYGSCQGVNMQRFDIQKKTEFRETIRRQHQIPDADIIFGFVGRLDREKGLNEVFESYQSIQNDHTWLMIVGPADKPDTLNQALYQESLKDSRIIYTGLVSNVEAYMSAMDIFIFPSYREGFGNVTIEAEALGLPVIVSDIPGPSEAMQDELTGLLVKKEDVLTLKEAMIKLMNNPSLREQYGRNGVQFVKKRFSSEVVLKAMVEDRMRLLNIDITQIQRMNKA
ncbi:MAG: glycosyltransferase family 1 protein [Erysipelotrichia bacterium]|nr:glycosyltransferase family 1 protein [Erysipelotrichia bacterium]